MCRKLSATERSCVLRHKYMMFFCTAKVQKIIEIEKKSRIFLRKQMWIMCIILSTNLYNKIIHISGINYGQLRQFVSKRTITSRNFIQLDSGEKKPCRCQEKWVTLHWQFEMSVRLRAAAQQCPDKPTLHSPCTAIVTAEEKKGF